MGANDDREMLGTAIATNIEFERKIEALTAQVLQRDARLAGVAEILAATPAGFRSTWGDRAKQLLASRLDDALEVHDRELVKRALHTFAEQLLLTYAIDFSSPTATVLHVVALAKREGAAGIGVRL